MTVNQQQLDETRQSFCEMAGLLGLATTVEATIQNNVIHLSVKTDDPGRLIGRNGQTLSALQHLLNGILLNRSKSFPKIRIDVVDSNSRRAKGRDKKDQDNRKEGGERDENRNRRNGERRDNNRRRGGSNNRRNDQDQRGNDEERNQSRDANNGRRRNDRSDRNDRGDRGERNDRNDRQDNRRQDNQDQRRNDQNNRRRQGGRDQQNRRGRRDDRERRDNRPQSRSEDSEAQVPMDKGERIRQQTLEAIKQVRRWGEPVKLPPMAPDECEQVHTVARQEKDIVSATDNGGGGRSRVTIRLA